MMIAVSNFSLCSFDDFGGDSKLLEEFAVQAGNLIIEDGNESALSMLLVIVKSGKLTQANLETGLMDCLEFLCDIKLDAPLAFVNFGKMIGGLLKASAVSEAWLTNGADKFFGDKKDEVLEQVNLSR